FQAEDGIRDFHVTGVQTCALPICALEQRRDYRQIYVSRPVVPLSNKDIGFLPGDIQSKLDPYMQPIWDNLKLIKSQFEKNDSTRSEERRVGKEWVQRRTQNQ